MNRRLACICLRTTLVASLVLLASCPVEAAERAQTLRVALFPYVPSPARMQDVIKKHWNAKHPTVALDFVSWDGYEADPTEDLDVFEYDAIYLDQLVRDNYASPLFPDDIDELRDFEPFALRGSMVDGVFYAIPRIACTPVLFYRKGDQAVAAAKTLEDLFTAIGPRQADGEEPDVSKGLIVDLSGGTTCACMYLDAVADLAGSYSPTPRLPGVNGLSPDAIANLQKLTKMAGKSHALLEEWEGKRARWFAEGRGRAFIGWTERLSAMPADRHKDVAVRALPLAADKSINLMFVDVLSINPLLSRERRRLAIEFANLCASKEVVLECFLVTNDATGSAQYLLPVRKSVNDDPRLTKEAPLYGDLIPLLRNSPRALRMNADVRDWLDDTKSVIRERIVSAR